MLVLESALNGFSVDASDGPIGTLAEVLFDDRSWTLRWLVVDTGRFLPGRKVLLHPSSIASVSDADGRLDARLTRTEIKAGPDLWIDQPVSRQMENKLYSFYGWEPQWGGLYDMRGASEFGGPLAPAASGDTAPPDAADPHLRSARAVLGYHVQATDGAIGHVEDLVVDTTDWTIRYLIAATRNWWMGRHVLLSPHAVREVSWTRHEMDVDLCRDAVKASPVWAPGGAPDHALAERVDGHYGWPPAA